MGTQGPSSSLQSVDNPDSEDDASSGQISTCATTNNICLVCGEGSAAMHYGTMACVGCKGFFRRALMKADQLECINQERCIINKNMRTACRSCRFQKCLESGMQPAAVRPCRDSLAKLKKSSPETKISQPVDNLPKSKEEWMKKMTVGMRTLLMNLLNIEAKVMKGDTNQDINDLYPLNVHTLQEIMENPSILNGKRSQMRYEPYRMAKNGELSSIAYRRLIAAIDWVQLLSELVGGVDTKDKIALIKNCFLPLTVFKSASRTAEVSNDMDILCLCNFAYVPRNISEAYADSYHLGNGLVGRALDELVTPYRLYGLREEEIVCVSAMLALNPSRDLSSECYTKIMEIRNRIQDVLFHIIREARMCANPAIAFGQILLSLPIVTSLANTMCENLQFAQTFSTHAIPLITDLFGCFPVEPFPDDTIGHPNLGMFMYDKGCQTDVSFKTQRKNKRRRNEDIADDDPGYFRLLQPPGNFTLTEMFDDISRDLEFDDYCYGTMHNDVQQLQPQASTSSASFSSFQLQAYPNMYGNSFYMNEHLVQPTSNVEMRTIQNNWYDNGTLEPEQSQSRQLLDQPQSGYF